MQEFYSTHQSSLAIRNTFTSCLLALFLFFLSQTLPVQAQPQILTSPDGTDLKYYLQQPDGTASYGLAVLLPGSGCLPVTKNTNINTIKPIFEDFAILTVEKRGVSSDSTGHPCPNAFHAQHTLSQWVADIQNVVEHLRTHPRWNGNLILFGGSEGGLAAAVLAALVNADVAILLSTGGGIPFGESVRQTVPEEGWPTVDAAFQYAQQNPESTEQWAGSSYRFWADILDQRSADDMLLADTAFLLIQGGSDSSSSPDIARTTVDIFNKENRCNLTYWEIAGHDHAMIDTTGKSRMVNIVSDAVEWAKAQMLSPKSACMSP